jgi:hypothetical protein
MPLLLVFFIFFTAFSFATEKIFDDCKEKELHSLHSYGILSYGFHSNTFHLRNCFLKYNFSITNNEVLEPYVQFFITFKGYKDTHIPETNYSFPLDNIELYDYGVNLWWWYVFLSLRGAATYLQNLDTFLLFTPYRFGLSSEFDSTDLYQGIFLSSPGIRAGIEVNNFLFSYSQGDYRHLIPSGFLVRFSIKNFYIRSVFLFSHKDPIVYKANEFSYHFQLSVRKDFEFEFFKLLLLGDYLYLSDNSNIFRVEEGILWNNFLLGIREIYNSNLNSFLFEASIKRSFYDIFSLGFQYGSDGKFYFGAEVNF